MANDYCDCFRFCFVNYWTMWKFAGVGFCLVTWLNTLHRSSYWPKFIVTIQLVWLLKLISEKYRALIALVVKLLLQMDLSYTLNASYYTAFYKHPTLLFFKLWEDSFLALLQSRFKIISLNYNHSVFWIYLGAKSAFTSPPWIGHWKSN